jgi:hypothetical protein
MPVLFHPDYTVGPGITPDLLTQAFRRKREALAGYTAGGELHPALRTWLQHKPSSPECKARRHSV